jgi:hypothetical protein
VLTRLFSRISRGPVSDAEIRAEIWLLGTRRLGEPLVAALDELGLATLPADRRRLLRACVRKMQSA